MQLEAWAGAPPLGVAARQMRVSKTRMQGALPCTPAVPSLREPLRAMAGSLGTWGRIGFDLDERQ